MNDTYDAAIDTIRKEIADRMRTVNDLCRLCGKPAIYPDSDGSAVATSGKIRPDQWYRAGLSTAAREFLEMRQSSGLGPASVDDIYAALDAGSFQFESRDGAVAKASLKQSLTKNSSIFHRLPNGTYGLAVWYPGIKISEENEKAPRHPKKAKSGKVPATARYVTAPAKRTVTELRAADADAPTVSKAVKEAIKAMGDQFTKQDVLNWVEKNYPDLGAKKPTVFVMVTRLRSEMGFTMANDSKGHTPGIFRKEISQTNGVHK